MNTPKFKYYSKVSPTTNVSVDHGRMIRDKPLLNQFYKREYEFFLRQLASIPKGPILEIGSGGGFFHSYVPDLIRSDITPVPNVTLVCNAESLPFQDESLSAIVMMNVLHHIPDCEKFLAHASRTMKLGGKIVLLEPATTNFSKLIYKYLHKEPFEENSTEWKFRTKSTYDRLMDANGALAWMIFIRDREKFHSLYPRLTIRKITTESPFLYLLSGGLSFPQLAPTFLLPLISLVESICAPINRYCGLFYRIVIEKV